MIPKLISVDDRFSLRLLSTERFKAGTLSLSTVQPITAEHTYLTSLMMSVLLRGSEKYPTVAALNRRLDYLYGSELSVRNFYRGDLQVIGLCANVLSDAYLSGTDGETLLDDVLEVMEQILFYPALDENGLLNAHYVESEKKLQCDTIRAQKNNPHAYAADRLRAMLYEGEPCGTPLYGTIEEVMAVTAETLTAHWRAWRESAAWHAFCVGSMDEARVADALKKRILPHLSGASPACTFQPHATVDVTAVKRATETQPIKQGHLVMGFRTGCTLCDADFYASTVFNELLGASPVSKLFMNVRERLGLCYSCSSVYNIYKGTLLVSCGTEHEKFALAESEIQKQIREIADGRFTDEEWQAAKHSLENAYRQLEDSPAAMESYYFGRALAGVSQSMQDCRDGFAAVTREQVIAVAERITTDAVFYLCEDPASAQEDDDDED